MKEVFLYMEKKGIDVSKWQGNIDWTKVKNTGIDFAIIREGYGRKQPNQIDTYFKANMEGALSVGLPVGVYHYSYAQSTSQASEEAEFCLENIQGYDIQYPVVFDIEDSSQTSLGKRTLTDICTAFCETIEKAGYYAMIYTNVNWLKNYLYSDELLLKFDLWLAQWEVSQPSYSCGIWQYSETGQIDGISGNVDLNISYKDYPEIIKKAGLNGVKSENNDTGSEANSQDNVYFEYEVQKGDTLWGLAEKYLGNGSRYSEIKSLNGLTSDIIFTGQTLKIPNQ